MSRPKVHFGDRETSTHDVDGVYRPDTVTIEHGRTRFDEPYTTTFHHYGFSNGNGVRIVTRTGELVIEYSDLELFIAEALRHQKMTRLQTAETWDVLRGNV